MRPFRMSGAECSPHFPLSFFMSPILNVWVCAHLRVPPVYKFLQNINGWDGVISATPAEQNCLLLNCAEHANDIFASVKTEKILSCFLFTRTSVSIIRACERSASSV